MKNRKAVSRVREKEEEHFFIFNNCDSNNINNNLNYSAVPREVQNVIVHQAVTDIYDSTFQHCYSLQTVKVQSHTKTQRQGHAQSLKASIKTASSLRRIHRLAFGNCTSLQSIQLPTNASNFTEIGQGAFRFCSSLTTIQIPSSVTSIGEGAFAGCTSLLNVTFHITSSSSSSGSNDETSRITSSSSSSSSILKIGQATFHGCSSLISIALPKRTQVITTTNSRSSRMNQANSNNNRNIQYPPFDKCSLLLLLQQQSMFRLLSQSNEIKREKMNRKKTQNQTHTNIMNWLHTRYDDLPIHKICYDADITTHKLQFAINHHHHQYHYPRKKQEQQLDALKMTSLHVLVCNPNVKSSMVKLLLDTIYSYNIEPSSLSTPNDNYNTNVLSSQAMNGMTPFQLFLYCQGISTACTDSKTRTTPTTDTPEISNLTKGRSCHDETTRQQQQLYSYLYTAALKMGLPWDILNIMFLLNPKCMLALSPVVMPEVQVLKKEDDKHKENVPKKSSLGNNERINNDNVDLPLHLQAAISPQCSLEVVFHLTVRSVY